METRKNRYVLAAVFFALVSLIPATSDAKRVGKKSGRKVVNTQRKIGHSERTDRLIKRINQNTRSVDRMAYAEALASHFSAPLSSVEDLRGKRSAGEVTVLLTMAQALSRRDPVHFATTGDALFEIDRQRALGKSWAAVAREAGLRMDDVLQSASAASRTVKGRTQTALR
jgi:hypothetical protein